LLTPLEHYTPNLTSRNDTLAARSKPWVCVRSLAGTVSSNPDGCMDDFLVSVVCCLVDVSDSARSLVQRSPTQCSVSECNREASVMRRPWPTRVCSAMEKEMTLCGLVLDLTQTCRCYILSVYLFTEMKSSFISK